MSLIATSWRNIKHWWQGTESKYEVSINQYPKEKAVIGIGGSTKISAYVTTSSPELFIKWQKVESHGLKNIQTDSIKYSGSSCSMPTPELIIHDVDITDAGVYQLSVTTVTGTIFGPIVRLNVFGDPVDSLPKEERNYLRYYLLCQKIATESVRCYFTRKVPEPTLAAHLNTYKSDLKSSYWKCTNDQIAVLFPVAPEIAKSSNFDFTLLYKLIRNTITPVSKPTRGWGPTPLSTDIKEEDDIERIRHNRNQLAHNTKFQLNDSDFNNFWTDLSQVIDRLSLGSLKADVIKISERKLDQQLKNEIFENLKKGMECMKDEINTIHQDMKECRERIQTIEDTHIPPNIRRTQIELLKVWKKDDELYYNSTNVYQASKDKIESFPTVALVGGPGCGKTATARHIALQYEQNGWEIVPVFRPEEIVLYGDPKLKQIFVLDDILGIFAVDMSLYNNMNSHREGIMNAISKESKLLCTCRKLVYNEALKLKSFVIENVVDLESKENILNDEEKGNLLAKHCRFTGVPEDMYCNLSLSTSFIMFPLLCKIFATTYENHVSVDKFFASPFACLSNELDMMAHSSPQLYAALVMCVLSNNMLCIEKTVDEKEMKLDAYNTCGVNLGTSDREIQNSLLNLLGTYLSENKTNFTCIHDAVFEIVAYHYGKTNPQVMLKYMNSTFISTKVTFYKDQRYNVSDYLSIFIDEKLYEQLAERLYTDLQSFELFDVFMNKSLRYLPFLKVFIKILREKPYYELKPLICHEQVPSKIRDICSNNNIMTDMKKDEYKEEIRQELLKNVYRYAREPHNPRIISWIIYYGHTNILTSIVSLVKENNDSTDIVFGSDITEQTRLLTLGCYSGDPDMVNLILKYVKICCINRTSLDKTPNCDDPERKRYYNMHRQYTPLTAACDAGYLSVVQILHRNNGNMNQCDDLNRFPLLTASEQGHYDVVEYLVQEGGNVNQCNEDHVTCLYGASYNGHYNIVKYLVQQGAQVNQCDKLNQSPLYQACQGGHIAVVEFLVENGADVNKPDKLKRSPLSIACQGGHIAVVEFLVENGADVQESSIFNISPLYIACEGGHTVVVKYLVDRRANVNQCDIYNKSPLYIASERGNIANVKYLVENGADVHLCDISKKFPLYKACETGHTDVVKYLVENGAYVNQCDKLDQSPLYKACEGGHKAVVEFLVEKGADVNQCDTDDKSSLYIPSETGNKTILEFLEENEAIINQCTYNKSQSCKAFLRRNRATETYQDNKMNNINQYNTHNRSPLYVASDKGHIGIVEFLVENRADVNQCDAFKQSPLYKASGRGHFYVVEYLVQQGANVDQCNINNESPLYKASEGGHYKVVEYLVHNGSDINQSNKDKKTPLYNAVEIKHLDMVKFLIENKADLTMRTHDGISPLQLAVWLNFFEIAMELISKENQIIPFLGNSHLLNILIDIRKTEVSVNDGAVHGSVGADIKQPLSKGLVNVIIEQSIECLRHLLKLGLYVNQCNNAGQSLLTVIIESPRVRERCRKMELLIQNGADLTVRDGQSLSLLENTRQFINQLLIWDFEIEDKKKTIKSLKKHMRRNSIY